MSQAPELDAAMRMESHPAITKASDSLPGRSYDAVFRACVTAHARSGSTSTSSSVGCLPHFSPNLHTTLPELLLPSPVWFGRIARMHDRATRSGGLTVRHDGPNRLRK
jgi:hypothetical protein